MKICLLPMLLMTLSVVFAVNGFYINTYDYFTREQYQCLKQSSYNFTFFNMPATDDTGNIKPDIVSRLNTVKSIGFITDIIILAVRNKSATAQVNAVMTTIPSSLYGTVWIWVYYDWSGYSADSNCAYLQELINSVKLNGKNPGIFAFPSYWSSYFGNQYGCPAAASQPLWYWNQFSSCSNFDDFKPFGGWTKPNVKSCGNWTTICGVFLFPNFYP